MLRFIGPWLVVVLVSAVGTAARADAPKSTAELGGYAGVWLPPDALGLYSDKDFLSQGHQPLRVAGDFGARGGYYFLPYLGAELELGVAPTTTELGGRGVVGWIARTHLVGRYAFGPVTPFVLFGGGLWAVTSEVIGDDLDPAFEWGIGVALNLTPAVAVRADMRGTFSEAYDSGLAHGVEFLGGVVFALGRHEPRESEEEEIQAPIEEPPARVKRDADDDGVEDTKDECPKQAGAAPKGCPAPPDADKDGVEDAKDECPKQAGGAPRGCPAPPDADKDGVGDDIDVCPQVAGDDGYGCPKQAASPAPAAAPPPPSPPPPPPAPASAPGK